MRFQATWESVKKHTVPAWYADAKLGVFVHWGIYSVPAYAPVKTAQLGEIPGDEDWFCNNPYAEWYFNSINVRRGPVWEHHRATYGADAAYEDFLEQWTASAWDPHVWAGLFKAAGARYVVLTAKHHDGFCLFPSRYTDYSVEHLGPKRNLYGELHDAVVQSGLKMGAYYSGLLDWKFSPLPIFTEADQYPTAPQTYAYADYAFNQVSELIRDYRPAVLWNDIGWPVRGEGQLPQLLAGYYNLVPDGVVNDRWNGLWSDYTCTEYQQGAFRPDAKWEHCRGIGLSFGINNAEDESDYLTRDALIRLLVETVSNNGNLLINIGPNADGTIHPLQAQRLEELGAWLAVNGEGIYGTRCDAACPNARTENGQLFFTAKDEARYLFVEAEHLNVPVTVDHPFRMMEALDAGVVFEHQRLGDAVRLTIRSMGDSAPVVCFRCRL